MDFPGSIGYSQPISNGYNNGMPQNPYAQQQAQNQQMQILKANLDGYIQMINYYLRVGIQKNEFTPDMANRLSRDLVADAQSGNGPVWQWICTNFSNRQASQQELWNMIDQRRYTISSSYGSVNFNNLCGNSGMPQNPYAGQYNNNFNNGGYNRPPQYPSDGASLADLFNRNGRDNRADAYSPRPDRSMDRSYYQNVQNSRPQPQPQEQQEPKSRHYEPDPGFVRKPSGGSVYRIVNIPDYEFDEYVGKNIPKTFMTAKAEKLVVSDNNTELDRYTAVDTEMKEVVKNVSEVKENLDAANIKVDKKTVVLASVDTAEIVKGDNAGLTQAFYHVNDIVAGMDKTDFVKVARTIMREIKSCGSEFQNIFEPKICEMFCNIMKIVTNCITPSEITRLDDIETFDDIDKYLDKSGKTFDVYNDVDKYNAALKAAVTGSMLAIFGIKDSKRLLDISNEEDKTVLLDNKELPVFVDGKPYRYVYGNKLTDDQITQVDKELKNVFSYKIRRKILLHNIPEFSFLMSKKYQSNLLNTDALHQSLLTTLIDKAMNGSVYMTSLTQTKSDSPLFLVAKNYNGTIEASEI